jgi:dephospho-CoA kinase
MVIGLTGGIGSGKSLVAKLFRNIGVPVFEADLAGRTVLDDSEEVRNSVIALLGESVYSGTKADRKMIASIVFPDNEKLQRLNQLIHPAVAVAFADWKAGLPSTTAYCIRESAILFESKTDGDCDKIISVTAPVKIRISRVIERDRESKESVNARISKQMKDSERIEKSDFVIINDGESAVIPQVMQIHDAIMKNRA